MKTEPDSPGAAGSFGAADLGAALDAAIERGSAFLTAQLAASPDGLWHDYGGQGMRPSNVWVAAYMGAHVGHIPAARSATQAVVAKLLEHQRPSGGWGFDVNLLEDCDSTAWVLLAAKASGTPLPRQLRIASVGLLLRHQAASGGFCTYGPKGIELFGGVEGRQGWFAPQPCVTSAALAALATYASPDLPAIDAGVDYLWRVAVDQIWQAYWWCGFPYATYHAVRALALARRLGPSNSGPIAAAIVRRQRADGGWAGKREDESLAFTTALALLTLLELGWPASAELLSGANLLLRHQREDGSFPGSAELLVPGASEAATMIWADHGRFTTSCVLHALYELRERHRLLEAPRS